MSAQLQNTMSNPGVPSFFARPNPGPGFGRPQQPQYPNQNYGYVQPQIVGTDMFGQPIYANQQGIVQPQVPQNVWNTGIPQYQQVPQYQQAPQYQQYPQMQFNEPTLKLIAEFVRTMGHVLKDREHQLPCTLQELQRALTPNDPWVTYTGLQKVYEVLNQTYDQFVQSGRIQHGAPVNQQVFNEAVENFMKLYSNLFLTHVVSCKQESMYQQDATVNNLLYGQPPQMPGVNPLFQQQTGIGIPHVVEGESRTPNRFAKEKPNSSIPNEVTNRINKALGGPVNKPDQLSTEEEHAFHQRKQWYHNRGMEETCKGDEFKSVEQKREILRNWIFKMEELREKDLFVPTKDECVRWNLQKGKVYRNSDKPQLEAQHQARLLEAHQEKVNQQELERQDTVNAFDTELAEQEMADVIEVGSNIGVNVTGFGRCKNKEVDSLATSLSLKKGFQTIDDCMPEIEAIETESNTEEFTHVVDGRAITVLPIPTETISKIRNNLKEATKGQSLTNLWKLGIETAAKEPYGEIKPLFKFMASHFTNLAKRHIRMNDDLEGLITLDDFMDVEDLINHEFKRFSRFPRLKEKLIFLANKTVEMILVDENSLSTHDNHPADILKTQEASTLVVDGLSKDEVFFGTQEDRDAWVTGFFSKYSVFRIRTRIAFTNLIEAPENGETVELTRLYHDPKLLRFYKGLDYVSDLKEQNEFVAPFGNISQVVSCEKGIDDEGLFVKPTSVMDLTNVTLMDANSQFGKEVYLVPIEE